MLTDVLSVFVVSLDFSCSIINDKVVYPNLYTIKVGIDPLESGENIGLGLQRIKYLTHNYLQNSIFVWEEYEHLSNLKEFGNNLILFPAETYDFFIGAVLMVKFQTITSNYFDIQYLTIASMIGDNVQYNIVSPYDSNLQLQGDYWWNQDNVYTGSNTKTTWNELNLTNESKFKPTIIKGGLSENR